MTIQVRSLETSRLCEAMGLVKRVFMEFEAPEYSPEGVDFFLNYIEVSQMKGRIEKGDISLWYALLDSTLVGVIAMRPPCAVSLLFVDKEYHKKGIAKEMLTVALSEYCQNDCDVTVHSSPYAVPAYQQMGFVKTGAEETEMGIRFQPMVLKYRKK